MKIAFTVDVDRDAAWPVSGQAHAVTKGESRAVFEATKKGFDALLHLLSENGWPATFFFEATTADAINAELPKKHEAACHGLNHEDFTGESTGIRLTANEKREILLDARSRLEARFCRTVCGFRAPYLHCDRELFGLLKETGFTYDSSLMRASPKLTEENGLTEAPLLEADFGNGKKSSYLWRLMEGAYSVEDYCNFTKKALEREGLLILATHSWHSHLSMNNGTNDEAQAEKNLEKVRVVLESCEKAGAEPCTLASLVSHA